MEYEPCSFCGGKVIDTEPHYIPLGTDNILKIIDQQCTVCGAAIIGNQQKIETIKNQKAHDKLLDFMQKNMHKRTENDSKL